MDDARFFQKLRAAFQAEAAERIVAMEAALDVLEEALALPDYRQHPEAVQRLDGMYRELHSLKGAGRTVDLPLLEALCQGLESSVWRIKRGESPLEFRLIQLLREAVVLIRTMTAAAAAGTAGPSAGTVETFLRRLDGEPAQSPAQSPAPPPAERPDTPASATPPSSTPAEANCPEPPPSCPGLESHTVRLPTAALEGLLGQVEGLLTSKNAAALHATQARALQEGLAACLRTQQGDSAMVLEGLVRESRTLAKSLARHHRIIATVVDELLESITQTLLLPWDALLEGYPRMVQDIAASQGKQVQLTVQGADASIDRRILEQLGDAFLHLLRNAVDHGIESPTEREAAGKPGQGRIDIRIEVLGGDRTRIVIVDDGRGVDCEAVRRKAVQRGMYTPEDAALLDTPALLDLIWRPEFSTRDHVDHISGRGLGMNIVREKLERVGGNAQLRTTPGQGSVVTLHLPLSLMRFEGLVVACGGRRFIVRKGEVHRVVQAAGTVCGSGAGGMLVTEGSFIQVAAMARLLGLDIAAGTDDAAIRRPVLIAGETGEPDASATGSAETGPLGLMVDAILGEADVTLRSLGPQLTGLRGVRGVVLLGDGELVPVLDVADLRQMARTAAAGPRAKPESGRSRAARRPRRVLVAEDSITSRMLLKNVLETAGYVVLTAVDGQEALVKLQHAAAHDARGPRGRQPADAGEGMLDALVSDVEMPRMDGLELVRRIRADAALARLPVVLVTSLADPVHQEAGMQAGADAYIVKSRFDQSDLLQTLSRLLPTA
ncbi:hybrid sensor histidine kinase/response regulator [Megalodesulfovibrio gigas]|uniref:histidine kinase n=1 Tax=Megalodesulfovibrio gigas (strain ATCC 19364 / DSM 1382 / NCIMB 9332 / VKM B-1759) TaxID=1121448 RepID=T2GBQ1_MEGG1|nr:response regulator [Megalodesulfovibrio gigas]AGW13723.1 putative CheA signal transduction histidine kinase [Megalodesulfovibrio gigas DSM 1382 = ATCC 19364]